MLPYRSAPGIPCVRFALRKGRGCLNRGLRGLGGWAVMARARSSPGSGFPPARE